MQKTTKTVKWSLGLVGGSPMTSADHELQPLTPGSTSWFELEDVRSSLFKASSFPRVTLTTTETSGCVEEQRLHVAAHGDLFLQHHGKCAAFPSSSPALNRLQQHLLLNPLRSQIGDLPAGGMFQLPLGRRSCLRCVSTCVFRFLAAVQRGR